MPRIRKYIFWVKKIFFIVLFCPNMQTKMDLEVKDSYMIGEKKKKNSEREVDSALFFHGNLWPLLAIGLFLPA